MAIKKVETPNATIPAGHYSQGIIANGFVFIAGHLPVENMSTGELCTGSMAEQARCSLRNVQAVAQAAGTDLCKAVKVTVFLTDMADFAEVNAEYAKFFTGIPPARSCIAVAALPRNARIEIEAICAL